MNRDEFMQQLARLLSDLPENERMEAIRYYNDYFDEAGPENEANVIRELGSPGKVAAIIKADLKENGNAGTGLNDTEEPYHSEQGNSQKNYQDDTQNGFQGETQSDRWRESQNNVTGRYPPVHKNRGAGRWALIIIFVIFLSPLILGVGGGIFGVLAGILAVIFGVWISILTAGAGLFGGGIALFMKGIIKSFTMPASGLLSMGGGLLSIGLGIFLLIFFFWLTFRLFPRVFRAVVNFISRMLHKRKGAAVS